MDYTTESVELTLEQQFDLKLFNLKADQLTQEQAVSLAKELYRQLLVERMLYRQLLSTKWGIGHGS